MAAATCSVAHAEPAEEAVELRRGWVAVGVGGDPKWYRYETRWLIEGGVRPTRLPAFLHGHFVKGSEDHEDFGGVSWMQFRLGAEGLACIDANRIACGFVGADISYLAVDVDFVNGNDSIGGFAFVGRVGIDIGSRTARGRVAFDFTRAPGARFERTYRDAFDHEGRFDFGKLNAIVIAAALQF